MRLSSSTFQRPHAYYARNVTTSAAQRRRNEAHTVKPSSPLEWLMMSPNADEPEEANADQRSAVEAAIASLPEHDHDLILAIFAERLSYAELADRLGCSTPHAWRKTQKVIASLRKTLIADARFAEYHDAEEAQP